MFVQRNEKKLNKTRLCLFMRDSFELGFEACPMLNIIKIYGWTKHFNRPVYSTSHPVPQFHGACAAKRSETKLTHTHTHNDNKKSDAHGSLFILYAFIAILIHVKIFRNEFQNKFLIWTLTNCNAMIGDQWSVIICDWKGTHKWIR